MRFVERVFVYVYIASALFTWKIWGHSIFYFVFDHTLPISNYNSFFVFVGFLFSYFVVTAMCIYGFYSYGIISPTFEHVGSVQLNDCLCLMCKANEFCEVTQISTPSLSWLHTTPMEHAELLTSMQALLFLCVCVCVPLSLLPSLLVVCMQ